MHKPTEGNCSYHRLIHPAADPMLLSKKIMEYFKVVSIALLNANAHFLLTISMRLFMRIIQIGLQVDRCR